MNTDSNNRFDPAAELQEPQRPDKHWSIPVILFIAGMLIIFLWAFYSRGCVVAPDGLGGVGGGISSGSGDSGQGSGSGDNGQASGQTQAAAATGTGNSADAPGSSQQSTGSASAGNDAESNNNPERSELPPANDHQKTLMAPLEKTQTQAARPNPTGGSAAGRKGFYGIESKPGGKVLFLVDTSPSMMRPSREIPDKNLLQVLQMELKKSVFGGDQPQNNYRRSGGFIIISFNSTSTRYPAKNLFRYRRKQDMLAAEKAIDSLHISGTTHMRQAWLAALKVIKQENIRTVFFLTDGYSLDGFNAKWLNEQIRKSSVRKLTIHCISLGEQRNFMQQIAREHNGKYIFIP